jgi:hypothetical protein
MDHTFDFYRLERALRDESQRLRTHGDVQWAAGVNVEEFKSFRRQVRKQLKDMQEKLDKVHEERRTFEARTESPSPEVVGNFNKQIVEITRQIENLKKGEELVNDLNMDLQGLQDGYNDPAHGAALREWGSADGAANYEKLTVTKGVSRDQNGQLKVKTATEAHFTNLRVLAAWDQGGKQWEERNKAAGREPMRSEVLNAPGDTWTDYLNQGWLQSAYDRRAGFRMLSALPAEVVKEHNDRAYGRQSEVPREDYAEYLRQLGRQSGNQVIYNTKGDADMHRLTYYAQELVDLLDNNYVLTQSDSGDLLAQPRDRADLMESIKRARGVPGNTNGEA